MMLKSFALDLSAGVVRNMKTCMWQNIVINNNLYMYLTLRSLLVLNMANSNISFNLFSSLINMK